MVLGPKTEYSRGPIYIRAQNGAGHRAKAFRVHQHYYSVIVIRVIIKPWESTNFLKTCMETTLKEG